MNVRRFFALTVVAALMLTLVGCSGSAPAAKPAADPPAAAKQPETPVTITVWDFYGDSTPIKPLIPAFEKEFPNIKVKFEAVGWNGFWQKLPIAITNGDVPDVVTTGLMWAPEYKANGAYADLVPLSGGKLNGKPFDEVLPKGSMDAAKDGNKVYGMAYDFDAYAFFYRQDLFEAAGIKEIPQTWEGLAEALKKVSSAPNRYGLIVEPSWNGWDSYLYAWGGAFLDKDGKAALNSPAAVDSLTFMQKMVKDGVATTWTPDTGDLVSLLKSGKAAAFINGPYMMGVLRTAAPEMAGKWRVASLPKSKAFGSHIGGVHLSIMAKAKQPKEAWKFVEFLMRTENQVHVWKSSGAAPALLPALEHADVVKGDPYFGNQAAISIFKEAIKQGTPNPTIAEWTSVAEQIGKAVQEVLVLNKDPKTVLTDYNDKVNKILKK
ncbi:MAG TPA: extracellular solute-binding protein [Symbiobacteriaceae bacterium]|nr:extracellular solute-binding protein [Symbiobacteriaceae bacterium]